MTDLIYFKCFKVDRKLRIRVISPGYNHEANCQFPRDIRKEGLQYSAPVSDLSFSSLRGKFFYRVSKHNIKILENELESDLLDHKVSITKIFESGSEVCIICQENPNEIVIAPCGHHCLCEQCAKKLQISSNKCPLCRTQIGVIVTRDQLQL